MRWNRFQTAVLLLCLMMFAAGSAWSQCGCGLRLQSKQGPPIEAPVLGTTVEVRVTGIVARTRVTQIFKNPGREWVTGVYLFPLPDGAAVDTLRLTVGDRKMEGVVQTQEEAQETLRTAAWQGRKASLLEQVRPGLYTTSVANVGPDETVEVEIEMQQVVAWERGRFVLRFPMLAPPRYTPVRKAVADREIEPEIPSSPTSARTINPFSFHVDLAPGFPLGAVTSSTHKVTVAEDRKGLRWAVDLAAGIAPADGDFILEWAPAVGREPRAVYFTEEVDGEQYSLLMMIPPDDRTVAAARLPRETTFVIDHSGSMAGTALQQAKEALYLGVARLQPGDRFNVIRFCQRPTPLFPESVPVTPESLEQARQFIAETRIDGGTEMLSALQMALGGPAHPELVQQVVFATDGQVSNEAEILRFLRSHLEDRRLFTVAIGPAPNSGFLRRAAESGRGALTQIPALDEVAKAMAELFERLESPILRDIDVQWSDPSAEAWPARVPDLYLGEPLVVSARFNNAGPVAISGLRNGSTWQDELPSPAVVKNAGLDKLWAGRKIQSLMDSREDPDSHGGADEVRREVTELGLRHHLVTDWTSLVAVDVEVTAPAGVEPKRALVPVNAPRGSSGSDVGETITVTAESPLLDARRVSTGATVSRTEIEKVPSTRDPWAVLQATPGILTDRVNVGGNESGQQRIVMVPGAPEGQNSFVVDGLVITDMAALGAAPSYFDFDAFEELQVDTGGADVTLETAGARLTTVRPRGTDEWRASLRGEGSAGGLLVGKEDEARLDSLLTIDAETGGPIVRDRLWIWGEAGRDEIDRLALGGQREERRRTSGSLRVNAQATESLSAALSASAGDAGGSRGPSAWVCGSGGGSWMPGPSSAEDGPGSPLSDNSFGISEISHGTRLAFQGWPEASTASTRRNPMRSTKLFTVAVLALSLSAVASAEERWAAPRGGQDYRYQDRYNYRQVSEFAREIARTADSIHREYDRNNRRPNRDEARVSAALDRLEEQATRFYSSVDDYGDRQDSRRSVRDFESLLRTFDATTDTLRYIQRRPYVDRGLDRIWSLLSQIDRYYGVSGSYGRGYEHNRYDRYDDRNGRDRYDGRDRRDDRYRPPVN